MSCRGPYMYENATHDASMPHASATTMAIRDNLDSLGGVTVA